MTSIPEKPTVFDLPLVTAIAVCYNHERFLGDCLASIRQQDYPHLQIIIADDCSIDSSPALIQKWMEMNPELQATFIRSEPNQGLCKVLNRILTMARGKYVSMIATDDAWEPDKISAEVAMMESLPETTGVLYSDASLMDEDGNFLPGRFIESHREFERMPEGNIHALLWEGNFIPAMTTLIRRSVFDKVGSYDENLFYEDWDMWLRISEHYDFAYFPRPTARYRIVQTSMSKSSVDKMTLANELMFTKFLLRKGVPKELRSQAFNFAVRRAYREKATAPGEARNLLETMMRLYKSPRLVYAWMLYLCGFEYRHYEESLKVVKRMTRFAR